MNVRCMCVLFEGMFIAVVACVGCAPKSLDDLPNLTRDETLWTGPSGSKVVIYRYGMAVGKTPEALVCEQAETTDVVQGILRATPEQIYKSLFEKPPGDCPGIFLSKLAGEARAIV